MKYTYKRTHGKLFEMFWHSWSSLSIRGGWMYMNTQYNCHYMTVLIVPPEKGTGWEGDGKKGERELSEVNIRLDGHRSTSNLTHDLRVKYLTHLSLSLWGSLINITLAKYTYCRLFLLIIMTDLRSGSSLLFRCPGSQVLISGTIVEIISW